MTHVNSLFIRFVLPVAVLLLAVAAWQVATTLSPSFFFPTADQIGAALVRLYLSGPVEHLFLGPAFFADVVPSVTRLLTGWAIAAVVGIALGFAIGLLPRLAGYLDPVLQFLRSVPPPVIIPLYLVLFGIGDSMKVLFIATGVLWPILLNTIDGVRNVPVLQLDTARIFKISVRDRLLRIILPSAAPKIFAGLSIGMAIAIVIMVLSEMVAPTNGIGFMILQGQRGFRLPDMWAGVLVLGAIGFVLNSILLFVEHRVLLWHRRSKGNV